MNALAEIIMMLIPGAIASSKKIIEWCKSKARGGSGKTSAINEAMKFLQAISISTDVSFNLPNSALDQVHFKLCGCRASHSQMLFYTSTIDYIGKTLLKQSGKDYSGFVAGKNDSPVNIQPSVKAHELAIMICQLHRA